MADINEILGRQINSVKELKTAIKELQDSLVGVDAESEEFKTTTQQLSAAQDELNKVTRAGKADTDAAKDSIVGMRQEYKALYDQYKLLSDEQRNSDFGKNMASSLETLSTKINEAQKNVGSFKDNIGRYSEGVTDAFNKMGVSAGALKGPLQAAKVGTVGLNGAFKALAANPIMLVITAIVAILVKAAAAIKQNEELTNRLREAMAVFKPILDAVANAFDFLAGIIVKVVEGLSKVAEKIMSIIPGMRQAIQSHKDLAKATNDLTKAQRENSVVASQKQAEIERLREEASATEDVTEKRRLLEEAKALQAEVDQREIELAQEELRILQEYGEKTANAAEENEKLAAAQKKVNDLIAQGERNQRMYNKQLDATTKKTASATSAGKNYREEAKKLYEQTVESSKTELQKLTEKYEKERKLLAKYGYDTSLLTKQYNKDRIEIILKEQKREKEVVKTFLDGQIDNINRSYTNLASLHTRETERLFIEGSKLDAFKNFVEIQEAKIKGIISGAAGDIRDMWEYVFNNADLRKFDDFDYMKDFLSVFTTNMKDEDIQKIINGFNTLIAQIGEEGWSNLTSGLTNTIKNLNDAGIDIKNLPDFKARIADLGNKAAEAFGDSFNAHMEEVTKDAEEASMQLELDLVRNSAEKPIKLFQELSVMAAENAYDSLSVQKAAYEQDIVEFKGTQEQKIELLHKYYDVVKELREAELNLQELTRQRTAEMFESLIDLSDRMAGALSTYRSSQEQLIDSQLKAGQIDEQEANKKKKRLLNLQRVERDFSIATITADAAAGIFSVWRGYATEVGQINPQTAAATGPAAAGTLAALNAKSLVTAIAKTAGLASTAIAQIAAARNGVVAAQNNLAGESGGGAGSAGVAATPQVVDSTPYTYTRTIQTQDEKDELNRPIYVTVTDIEDGLNHKVQVTDESSF